MMETEHAIVEADDDDVEPLCSVPNNDLKTKARSTLPEAYLRIGSVDLSSQYGIYAKCSFPYKTQFGPLDAPLVPFSPLLQSVLLLKSKMKSLKGSNESDFLYFNTYDEGVCNWMCLVRPASTFEEQNLIAHFVKNDIYFTSTRNIEVDEELRVWYAPKYAQFMGRSVLIPGSSSIENSYETQQHSESNFQQHQPQKPNNTQNFPTFEGDLGLNEKSVPPKKRGWKRANHLNKVSENNFGVNNISQQNNISNGFHQSVNTSHLNKQRHVPMAPNLSSNTPTTNQNRMYSCPECGKFFSKKFTLKMHETVHSKKYDFLCHVCGKAFKRKDKMHDHFKRMHGSVKIRKKPSNNRFVPRIQPKDCEKFLYKCLRCAVGFQRRGMLVNHFSKKHPDVDISTIPELELPVYKDEISFSCLYCNKLYKSNYKRKEHILKHHPDQPLPTDIRKSGASLSTGQGLLKMGSILIQPFTCPHCPSQYTSKAKLKKHIQTKHVDNSDTTILKKKTKTNLTSYTTLDNTVSNVRFENTIHNIQNIIPIQNASNSVYPVSGWSSNNCASHSVNDNRSYSTNPDHEQILNVPTISDVNRSQNIENPLQTSFVSLLNDVDKSQDFANESSYSVKQVGPSYSNEVLPINGNIDQNGTLSQTNQQPTPKNQLEKSDESFGQKFNKPLSSNYSLGRKHFLLQFRNGMPPKRRFEEKQNDDVYAVEKNLSNDPSNSGIENVFEKILDNPEYTTLTSPPRSIFNQTSVAVTPLPYTDDDWGMYGS